MSKEIRRLREERIKSFAASALIAQTLFAGVGIMAMGVVIVLGGAFDLALPLADSYPSGGGRLTWFLRRC
ncbi:hypothetical protein B6V73_19890 [Thioclava sp. JM3]|uniref:hypothetical protein n=1 Tax=Thioclava sp. JM3 TaxID=1973004 RepID=UPI000B53A386|nr:hypothetical protein [Thioclava sp. JM3]OWY09295.1 hypothetical protein B6V73_19890 [Thioclava sp. JM3]